ncbi:MAG: hypothetical protein KC912_19370 [Proteobacteria bacterium]|nr:hypothetical protein [Pseudomonadota bacterium]
MSEEPEFQLPELQDTMLDAGTLQQLVHDLTTCTTVLDVLLKGGPMARTDAKRVSLADAVDQLQAGAVFGVQVRYRWEEAEWRDTLMRTPGGIRLVRMRMPDFA